MLFTKPIRRLLILGSLSLLAFSCKKDEESTLQAPVVSSLAPDKGPTDTQVIITGTNFSATANQNTVQFNGKAATVTAATDTQLTVTVPAQAGDGPVTVTVGGKTGTGPAFDYQEAFVVTTLAGSTQGAADGTGTAAQFKYPAGVVTDASGNLYVVDTSNHNIRKITPAGVVTTLVGSTRGSADGTGPAAQFNSPYGITIDASGNLYVADSKNHRIRKITSLGVVTTLAGSYRSYADGTGVAARFYNPEAIAVDASGNLYAADTYNHRIRKITPSGVVTTLAGSTYGYANGTGTAAKFGAPAGVTIDASGNLYVADTDNDRIRKITPSGVVTTLAGSGTEGFADGTGAAAQFNRPAGITIDASGNLYVADTYNHRIRKITPSGVVTTLLGGAMEGYADGTSVVARFAFPAGITVDASGNLYVADLGNSRIRKINMQ